MAYKNERMGVVSALVPGLQPNCAFGSLTLQPLQNTTQNSMYECAEQESDDRYQCCAARELILKDRYLAGCD